MQHCAFQHGTVVHVKGRLLEGGGDETSTTRPTSKSSFEAQLIVMNHPGKITKGYTPVIDCHTAHVACRFVNIRDRMDRRTGKILEANPESIQNGDAALVTLEPTKPLCVEAFADFPALGRFVVRDNKQTVAVGTIKATTKIID